MEHIEEAGIHSGDSACVLPPFSLPRSIQEEISRKPDDGRELKVRGLMNVQFAIKDGQVYILEVNPRASRTVPFVCKATGVSLAKLAAKVMMGKTLQELGITGEVEPPYFAVKESVFPFRRFPAWTSSWAPRCAPPAKSWASTRISAWPSPSPKWPPARSSRCLAAWSSASRTPTRPRP